MRNALRPSNKGKCNTGFFKNKNQDTWLCQTQAAARQPTQLSWYGRGGQAGRRGGKAGPTDRPTDKALCRPTLWVWQKAV